MSLFRKKITAEEFIQSLVDEILKSENKVDFSNTKFFTDQDIGKLKEYILVFRLHLLSLYLTVNSKNVFDVGKTFVLTYDSIKKSGRSLGWSDDKIKQTSDAVYAVQQNYEARIGEETQHPDDLFFHSCRYFSEFLFPDEPKGSEKSVGSFGLATSIYKNLNKIFKRYTIVIS
ncbi:MAG: hypothetical protein H6760_05345 [Candidatus Nomurabacteria bacterium]|nr:MAG: hypothetical protein H6760_05345 [Candidatus Nomurabacteria bacterium]